jgi:cell division protein FtsI/penicillin-binding protein 2
MKKNFPRIRLILILAGISLAGFLVIIRLVSVQIIDHHIYEKKAERQWFERKVLYSRRGRIFDRNGNPVAVTCCMYNVGITPRDFPPAASRYLSDVTGHPLSRIKSYLQYREKDYIPLCRRLNLDEEDLIRLSSLSGVSLDPVNERILPFDSIDRNFVGMVNEKGEGVGGIERSYDDILRGEDGWVVTSRDALNRSVKLIGAPRKNAVDGGDIYLTIDSDIQRIADFELKRAVKDYDASGGIIIIVDPRNGDILALAEHFPSGDSHVLYSSSCYYEPGSTFKLMTYSYMLQDDIVDINDVFDGENGEKLFDFGVIKDDHPHNLITLKESFIHSSNICTIKAVSRGDREDFYRFLLRCGFGCRTGIDLPAETKGILREPGKWTSRSLPSISIGHEIGVTPLQMAYAYAAVANGGELFVPRVVMGMEKNGEMVKEIQPVKTRRVLSEEVSEKIRGFCREVVLEGTGGRASTDFVPVAGKTGTAQKAGDNGYVNGKYISSFVGFAPVDEPRVVCLVILDEPSGYNYYGGVSAAPVFRNVIEGICLSSEWIPDGPELRVKEEEGEREMVRVPVLLRMGLDEACRKAARAGIIVNGEGGAGDVYSQNPGPGELVPRGSVVDVLLRDSAIANNKVRIPDFRGLTVREARRELIKFGLEIEIRGYGTVRKQHPAPGAEITPGSRVVLYCRSNYRLSRNAGMEDGRS